MTPFQKCFIEQNSKRYSRKPRSRKFHAFSSNLNRYRAQFLGLVSALLEKSVFKANRSRYCKRWWNSNLSVLRAKFINLKNRGWQFEKKSQRCLSWKVDAKVAKYEYQKTMKKAKRQYSYNFLDDIKNIWQTVRYLERTGSGFISISKLKRDFTKKDVTNEKKSATNLLSNFLLLLLSYLALALSGISLQLKMSLINKKNIRLAIFTNSLLILEVLTVYIQYFGKKFGRSLKSDHIVNPTFYKQKKNTENVRSCKNDSIPGSKSAMLHNSRRLLSFFSTPQFW